MSYCYTQSNPVLKSVCILYALIHQYIPPAYEKRKKELIEWGKEIQHMLKLLY